MILLEEALEIIDRNTNELEVEEVELLNGIGKILADNIYAPMNIPPFNKSAMDGYAVAVNNIKENEILEVIDTVYAGEVSEKEVLVGTCIRIMTGAPIPKGANGVIKQEDVISKSNRVLLKKSIEEGENICIKGEDIKKGKLIVKKCKKLDYGDIGVMSSLGIKTIKVFRLPKVAFISTGDEVVDIDEALEEGKIYNSNKYSILSRIIELGYEVNYISHVKDNYEKIGEEIYKGASSSDIVITTGGASVGEKDLLNEAIDIVKGEKLFWKIKIKPGSSVLCSKVNNKLVISLSGNPTAALTTFELLVKTVLEKLSGKEKVALTYTKGKLMNDYSKNSPRRRFVRGMILDTSYEKEVYITQVKNGNGILSSTLNSNCLIEIDEYTSLSKGDLVKIIKL